MGSIALTRSNWAPYIRSMESQPLDHQGQFLCLLFNINTSLKNLFFFSFPFFKPLCPGLTFSRSQQGSCSAAYETPTQKQVIYQWFSTRFPTNLRWWRARGRPPFWQCPVSQDERLSAPDQVLMHDVVPTRSGARHAVHRGTRAAGRRQGWQGWQGTGCLRPAEDSQCCHIVLPGWDSDLEAFSHNPTDGSFDPLTPQPSTYTRCLNLQFLSYWAGLPCQQHITSRVKLTCLTTV